MSMQEDPSSKTFDPTPQKLIEARKKGDVAKSTDLMAAAGYAGLLVALLMAGEAGIRQAGTSMMVLIDQPAEIAPLFFDATPFAMMGGLMQPVIVGFAAIFVLPAVAVILSIIAQRAFVFAPSKVAPKLSRISLISNAKNKFGRDGIFEWVKSFTKLLIYSVCVAIFIVSRMPEMIASTRTSAQLVMALMAELTIAFLFIVVLVSTAIGGVDAVWQHFSHIRKNRMSHKEIQDEAKNTEGDPHLKQERRQRAMEAAQNKMMTDVPEADVVIVNPTHYAVALKWSKQRNEAPICVAKGVDEIARKIREIAQEAGVPIHRDPPTARALHDTTQIGQEIAPDFYRAVAAAIRFAEDMRQRARFSI
ncbi:MAG: flagellar type III secretion system protein FlhB [Pseudomonadota bacterium]